MRQTRLTAATMAMLAAAGIGTWLFAADEGGVLPPGAWIAEEPATWRLTGPNADALRRDALRRATIRARDPRPSARTSALDTSPVICRFFADEPTGTSPKFSCVLDGGEVVKVKYGRNPEIHAEVAAARLLAALGYPADEMHLVPRLRCYGCPRHPFLTSRLVRLAGMRSLLGAHGYDEAYSEFEWVAVERRFDAPAIETENREGWGWFELEASAAPQADLDALRLLAVFLAHWDNKDDNQRLVCLDQGPMPAASACVQPMVLIQDLGATFGPPKVKLAAWRSQPVWADRGQCFVSMRRLPWNGGTFPDAYISEGGRARLAGALTALSRDEVRALFQDARFGEYYSGTDDEEDLDAWTDAFEARVDQIVSAGPCPASPRSRP